MSQQKIKNRAAFISAIFPFFLGNAIADIMEAYDLSKGGHINQMRDDGITRYFDHVRDVAIIVFQELGILDAKLIITALLHDIREDTYLLTERAITKLFGEDVALWVKYLTKEDGVDYHARLNSCTIWQVLLCKLADRLHNLRTLGNCEADKQARKIAETRETYIPLCDKLIALLPEALKKKGEYLKQQIIAICDEHE